MSSTLTNVDSKHNALKERRNADKMMQMEIDKLVKTHVDGEDAVPSGCMPRLLGCLPGSSVFRNKRMAVATSEATESSSSTTTHVAKNAKGDVMLRFVGRSKGAQAQSENAKMEQAMQHVSVRVEGLRDRLSVMRAKAVASSQAGKKEEALREMKKAKGVEKQLATAEAALDALERQSDALAQTALQKELATALASANSQMKSKSKGLLSMAEKAVDDSADRLDESEDIAQVFEGLTPSGATVDEEELLEELNSLVQENTQTDLQSIKEEEETTEPTRDATWDNFPEAPRSAVASGQRKAKPEDRQSLLADHA